MPGNGTLESPSSVSSAKLRLTYSSKFHPYLPRLWSVLGHVLEYSGANTRSDVILESEVEQSFTAETSTAYLLETLQT